MSNTWDLDGGGQGGGNKKNFTKFQPGITKVRVLDEAPYARWTHWLPQFQRSITCPGFGCPIDVIIKEQKAQGVKRPTYSNQLKFALNVYNQDTKRLEIMDEGKEFMKDVKYIMEDLKGKNKQLSDVVLKIRMEIDSAGKRSYRIDIDSESPMSEVESKALSERTNFAEYLAKPTMEQVQQLLEVTENHKDEFVRITLGEQNTEDEETIEVEVEGS